MKIDSSLSPAVYKQIVKKKLHNFSYIGQERFSGHFIGPFFFFTHHCYWEWNRRITAEMNNAIGFIRQTPTGTRLHYIRTRGIFQPFYTLVSFLAWSVLWLLIGLFAKALPELLPYVPLCGIYGTLLLWLCTAINSSITENGKIGREILDYFLGDPTMGKGE
jgi:hypothetical protein